MSKPFYLAGPQFQQTSDSWVEFYQHYEIDQDATAEQGKKVWRDCDYASLVSKGATRKVPVKATDELKSQYPQAWEHYQKRREWQKTSLQLIGLRPSQIKGLEEHHGITSLEELAQSDLCGYFEPYRQCAQSIVKLRLKNDEEFRSGADVFQEREAARRSEGIKYLDTDQGSGPRGPITTPCQEKNVTPELVQDMSYQFIIS